MPFPNNQYPSVNPFAGSPYGQVQPPMMPQLNNLPQMQQSNRTIQNGSLYGRVVGDLNEIVADDVPRTGTVCLFPLQDYSCIYAKQCNPDNSVSTVRYIPEVEPQKEQEPQIDLTSVMQRLDDIENLVKNLNYRKPYHKNNNRNNGQNSKDEVSE